MEAEGKRGEREEIEGRGEMGGGRRGERERDRDRRERRER